MRIFSSALRAVLSIVVAALAVASLPLAAQEAKLTVTVIDPAGAVIPGAHIVADAVSTGRQTSTLSGSDGNANLDLEPGSYQLVVTARGFKQWRQTSLQLSSSQSIVVTLKIGEQQNWGPVAYSPEMPVPPLPAIVALIPYAVPKKPLVLRTAFAAQIPPDLILFNGTILTGNYLKEGKPQIVSAIAIGNGQIIAIGSDHEIKGLVQPQTRLQNLNGSFVMPGLNDAHTHLGGAGQTKLNIDLTGSKSLEEMLQRIQIKAQQSAAGHWLTGGGWDHTIWANKTLPTRQDLDRVTGDHPTLLERIDGHIAVVNTAALTAAGVTGKSKAPQGGAIDLDANGNPTGILRDTEMEAVEKLIPPPSHDDRRHGLELAIEDARSHGLTSVQDLSEWQDFLVFEELEKEGKLNLRISEWLPFNDSLDELKAHRAHHDINDPMLHTGMLKGFMDGSLGSRTAAMKAPYADEPNNSGLPRYDQAKLNAMAVERAEAGFQLGFHAIGDRAASMALEAFSQPIPNSPGQTVATGHRDRIEHAQVVDPTDIERFAKLDVIASMQPNHLLTDMNWAIDRLGPRRAAYSYAWKTFLDAGVIVAFGTDYPVEPITPFRGLYAAVTRTNEAGTKTYFPNDVLTRTQALYAYTQGSAYAEFAEKYKGKLVPGYDADFIVLDRNLLTIPAPDILKTKVLETVVAGKTVHQTKP
jgi:predicted amidohydrolase YtcJ